MENLVTKVTIAGGIRTIIKIGFEIRTQQAAIFRKMQRTIPVKRKSKNQENKKTSRKSNKEEALMLNIMRTQRESPNDFLLDSGASSHMSPNQDWFHKLYQISPREISLGDNSKVTAEAAGDIILKLPYKNGAILKLLISDVMYVPDLRLNLLSCSK